ncbi:putative RNA-directed DNA polymerase from transposon BS [Zootermopsis nevadensis]|uniref:Putative RNA-directed DNA polymerase from transposon BS n=1 Tax=Zootermopsis nevadensis TaxID=136037 RepID=A0A067QRU0_ZOONE|nr:putative RNA-directed DNA polymerase from transposon BS [Zootermopsis nevadensis]
MINEVMRAYAYAPASNLKLTSPSEVIQAIKGLKVGKTPGTLGIPNTVLRHISRRAITFLTKVFNAVLRRQHLSSTWKHVRLISILKPGKDPTLPSSHGSISLLEKLYEKIILTRVLHEVYELRLLRGKQFGFRPRHSTTMQLARLV